MKALEKTDRCPDCQVAIGEQHQDGCDVARCLWDGGQRLQCELEGDVDHDCGADAWTGYWPGSVEAAEFDWWIYWDGPDPERGWDYRGRGWVRVTADHPDARPDLNRLQIEAHWDRAGQRWVLR